LLDYDEILVIDSLYMIMNLDKIILFDRIYINLLLDRKLDLIL